MSVHRSSKPVRARQPLTTDPQWYKDAVIYELRVRSFNDGNGDGIGDFLGLTQKLDYLQDLGVTAIWLLPFYPSPGRDDGYDIADYTDVHPDMGTLDDFKMFLEEAHARGMRVITELVINHTSDQHPWFQRARRAPKGSPERDFYVWTDDPTKYREARIIFKDFEPSNWSWDPVAGQYFWHRFFHHQPDLNFDNPAVHDAVFRVFDFWMELGVDGLRLDAVPYLYEREGTMCENLPETHAFLKKLRAHLDKKFGDRMLLAEANQWPEDAASYFGNGDECHMNFHFPIMPRLFMSIHMEDRFPIVDILDQTPMLEPSCQWAMFLRNHDELTLEMVTDEERDYMYRAYATEPTMRINLGIRRRLAPLVGNNRRKIELMNGLLFSLPGTPVLYYGDEIGMGDNVYLGDRNGVRTPMQWSPDRNAGFSRVNPQRLILPVIIDPEYHYESVNVEGQQSNPNSLLWWTKRLIALRKRYQAFGRGHVDFIHPENHRVLAFVRQLGEQAILVVANLSRHPQYAELDLSRWKGRVPIELFGRTRFPAVGDAPYPLSLGGHEFYWFSLHVPRTAEGEAREASWTPPVIELPGRWEGLLQPDTRAAIEDVLPAWIGDRRWFSGRDRTITAAQIVDAVPVGAPPDRLEMAIIRVELSDGDPETYAIPLAFAEGNRASAQATVACLAFAEDGKGCVIDALSEGSWTRGLVAAIDAGERARGSAGVLIAQRLGDALPDVRASEPRFFAGEGGTVAVILDRLFLKMHRRLDDGLSADLETGRQLAATGGHLATPTWRGSIEYATGRGEPRTIAILQDLVISEGDAWTYTRAELGRYFERVLAHTASSPPMIPTLDHLQDASPAECGDAIRLIGTFMELASLLGRRTGEVHRALMGPPGTPFAVEPYSTLDQRSAYQSMRNTAGRVLRQLRSRAAELPPHGAELARSLIGREPELYRVFEPIRDRKLTAQRGRSHGNFHLGRVLFTGKDFVLVDFEGDRAKELAERRRKRSPLRDVASMIVSLHAAAFTSLYEESVVRPADRPLAIPWGRFWHRWTSAAFLRSWLDVAAGTPFVPSDPTELSPLLSSFVLERTLYDLGNAFDTNPGWVPVFLQLVADMVPQSTA